MPRITFAPRDNLDQYPKGETLFWDIMGLGGLVTDESSMHDFKPTLRQLHELRKATGMDVTMDTKIWQIAEKLETR